MRLRPRAHKVVLNLGEIGTRREPHRLIAQLQVSQFQENPQRTVEALGDTLPGPRSNFRSCLNMLLNVGGFVNFAVEESAA